MEVTYGNILFVIYSLVETATLWDKQVVEVTYGNVLTRSYLYDLNAKTGRSGRQSSIRFCECAYPDSLPVGGSEGTHSKIFLGVKNP